MDEMTIEEMHFAHMRVWGEVARQVKYSKLNKKQIAKNLGYNFIHGCPACHFTGVTNGMEPDEQVELCEKKCPLEWGTFGSDQILMPCERTGSPYRAWTNTHSEKDALKVLLVPLRKFPVKLPEVEISVMVKESVDGSIKLLTRNCLAWVTLIKLYPSGQVRFVHNGMENGDVELREDSCTESIDLFPAIEGKTFKYTIEGT